MKLITLPNTELRVSEICLGTGPLGGELGRAESFALLDAFVEKGGNFIDSAHVYSDWIPGEKSRSEKLIGAWLNERHNRQEIIIGTKGAHPRLESMHIPRVSPQEIITDLDESLAYMQVDKIDLYWLHRDDPTRPVEEIVDTMNAQVKAGKIRYFGASNWRKDRLREAQDYAARAGIQAFSADQVFWNAAVIDPKAIPDKTMVVMDSDLIEYHRATRLPAIPYTSQANGLFDRMTKGTLDKLGPMALKMYPEAANRSRYERICQVAEQTGKTVNQIVLAYLMNQPFVTIPIIGTKRIDHLYDSLQASGTYLTPEQLDFLAG